MRRTHGLIAVLVLLVAAIGFSVPYAGAFTGPEMERAADAYGSALQRQHTTAQGDIASSAAARKAAADAGNKPETVKSAEAVVGRALAGQRLATETAAASWLALARAWRDHIPKAPEGLWAAFKASQARPPLPAAAQTEALELAAATLLDQLRDTKTDFEFRTETIRKIGQRLTDDSYDEARIELERRQNQLPSDVRELVDLRSREERERALVVDRLMASIQGIDRIYSELAQPGRTSDKADDLKKALATRVLKIKRVTADARSDRAQVCVEFNLPLRSEAVEFISIFQAPRSTAEQTALTQPLARDRTVSETLLCVHGLEHGHTYHVALRKGLAAKVGATLSADYDTRTHAAKSASGAGATDDRDGSAEPTYDGGIQVPDRVATAGFRSSAFILPREGGGVVPLMTVNLDEIDLDLVRLSDRSLYRRIALGQIGNFVDYREFYEIKRHFSDAYWSGLVRVDKKRNETVTTELPVRRLLDERAKIAQILGSTQGPGATPLEEPHVSAPVTIDRLEGRYRVDKLSVEPGAKPGQKPGFYALVAKIPQAADKHFLGERPEDRVVNDESGTYAAQRRQDIKTARSYGQSDGEDKLWNRGTGTCQDQVSGRSVACLVSVQWLVVSDIGLSYYMGPNELYVVARSLASGKPVRNAKIELVAANNTVLASDATDSSGVVRFRSGLTRGRDGNRLAAIMAFSDADADFSFIDYKRDTFDLSEHGVAGRTPPKNFDVYIYTDRGIYRPEETINATVLVRDTEGSAPQRIPPITLRLRQSNGIVATEQRLAPEIWQIGGSGQQIAIPKTATLGTADLVAYLGETNQVIGQASLQIDHFRPDRARVTLSEARQWSVATLPDRRVTLKGRGSANYLYGVEMQGSRQTDAPGVGLTGELSVLFQRTQTPVPGCYQGFRFDRVEEEFTPRLHRVTLPVKTDATGQIPIETTAALPPGNAPVEAEVALTLFDEAGKVGVQSLVLPMPIERPWLGVRHDARLIDGREGAFRIVFDLMALAPGNAARASALTYKLFRERNAFVWHQQTNSWTYQQSVERVLAHEGTTRTSATPRGDKPCADANGRIEHELPLGRYLLELADDAGQLMTYRLDSGWSSTDVRAPTPDRLTIHADAARDGNDRIPTYKPGDTATFSVEAPFDGEVLLAIANEKVHLWDSTATTTDRRASVKLRIDPQWSGKSFYALATVFRRNTDGSVQRGPARAIGALYFNVDLEANRQVKLEILPSGSGSDVAGQTMELSPSRAVSLKLKADIKGRAWATVYAIDEGLLSLTRHSEPDPYRRLFGQRALPMSLFDNYGRILLAERAARDRPGGDGTNDDNPSGERSRRLLLSNYTSDRVVARFVGPVEFVNGEANVTFAEPFDFNGEVRLTAIAWSDEKVGAASRPVTMRQRIVSELRMPRTMAAGDSVSATISLHNVKGDAGRYRVSVIPRGPIKVTGLELTRPGAAPLRGDRFLDVDLPELASRSIRATINADATAGAALAGIDLKVEAADTALAGVDPIVRRLDVAVRPALLPSSEVALVKLAPGESLKLDAATAARLTGDRFAVNQLTVRAHAGTDLAAVLRDYGPRSQEIEVATLERQIWRGYALMHGRAPADHKSALAEVVRGVEALQTRSDFFSVYRLANESGLGESELIGDRTGRGLTRIEQSEIWRSALALDFLLQARTNGQPIGQPAFQRGVRALQAAVKSALRDSQSRDDVNPTVLETDKVPTLTEARLQMTADKDDPREALQRPRRTAPPRLPVHLLPAAAGWNAPEPKDPTDTQFAGSEQPSDQDKTDIFERDENIKDRSGPEFRSCREDYLYAALVLVRTDSIDRSDLLQLMRRCSQTAFRPLGSAILAAALQRFGLQQEARVILAGIDPGFGATGRPLAASDTDGRFDAMMLGFLSLAEAPAAIRAELQTRIAGRRGTAAPLSVAAQVWLMRSYAGGASGAQPGVTPTSTAAPLNVGVAGGLAVARTAADELVSEFVALDRLGGSGATLTNNGTTPAYVALLFRGVPRDTPATAPVPGFRVERRVLNQQGQDVIANNLPVRSGEMLYVLITGERDSQGSADATQLSDPVLVMDGTASGFEIVDRDVFELAKRAGVSVRAILPSEGRVGRLRMVEARDDGLLAVVRPSSEGKFSLGYTVRVIAPGTFVMPGTLVEDLRHTEVSVQTPPRALTILGGAGP